MNTERWARTLNLIGSYARCRIAPLSIYRHRCIAPFPATRKLIIASRSQQAQWLRAQIERFVVRDLIAP